MGKRQKRTFGPRCYTGFTKQVQAKNYNLNNPKWILLDSTFLVIEGTAQDTLSAENKVRTVRQL